MKNSVSWTNRTSLLVLEVSGNYSLIGLVFFFFFLIGFFLLKQSDYLKLFSVFLVRHQKTCSCCCFMGIKKPWSINQDDNGINEETPEKNVSRKAKFRAAVALRWMRPLIPPCSPLHTVGEAGACCPLAFWALLNIYKLHWGCLQSAEKVIFREFIVSQLL